MSAIPSGDRVADPAAGARATTIGALKPVTEANLPVVGIGFHTLQAFELTQRVAKMFAGSTVVPDTFKGNIGNCAIALEMAGRMGASVLMVMQNLDVIYGRPAWRSKFLIACFNQCGRFEEISYEWVGQKGKDSWGCYAVSQSKATGKKIIGPEVTIQLAKDEGWYSRNGSKWKTLPQLMLMYRAGAWLVNTTAPEISMGLPTDDEIRDTLEARRGPNGQFAVDLEALRGAPEGAGTPDPVAWVNTLNGQTTLAELEKSWQACQEAFGGSPPNDCHAAYTTHKEVLGEKEGKQLDL